VCFPKRSTVGTIVASASSGSPSYSTLPNLQTTQIGCDALEAIVARAGLAFNFMEDALAELSTAIDRIAVLVRESDEVTPRMLERLLQSRRDLNKLIADGARRLPPARGSPREMTAGTAEAPPE
jgi:hypothetical protein